VNRLTSIITEQDYINMMQNIERKLVECTSCDNTMLNKFAVHLIMAGGKRLRPLLVVLSASFGNAQHEAVINAATAVELIHLASLIHDDIIDNAMERRGVPSVNSITSNHNAILSGDFLFATAFGLLTSTHNLDVVHIMSDTVRAMCEGQVRETRNLFNYNLSEEEYLLHIEKKTGSLLRACCKIGARLANIPPEQERLLEMYGKELGFAFQILDDIMDYTLMKDFIGKPVLQDLSQGILTLPLIKALRDEEYSAEILATLPSQKYANQTQTNPFTTMELINSTTALSYSKNKAQSYLNSAYSSIDLLPDLPAKNVLKCIIQSISTDYEELQAIAMEQKAL
jgi:heptaprenyl diphosphate synthase